MSVVKCDICRAYYDDDGEDHSCPGLRTIYWLEFQRSLRHWMASDVRARFELYYAERSRQGTAPGNEKRGGRGGAGRHAAP